MAASLNLLAVAAPVQGAAVLVAAAAAVAALVLTDPRRRAIAVLVAPVAAALALATLAGEVDVTVGPALAVAAGAGLAAVAALAWLVHRRPEAFALLAVGALPFRVPVSVGDTAANLLVPLYAVIAAGCIAYAVRRLRDDGAPPAPERVRGVRRLELAFAAALGLYALQSLYSSDLEQALENVAFFYVPFALLFVLLLEIRWSKRLVRGVAGVTVLLALGFAAIGFVEFATGHLLIANAKVVEANDLLPYFRVNSLFFDPNIFGRYLALTMVLLATVLLWTRRDREAGLIAAALAALWVGLVFSLSQSSFAALLVGLAVLAALRWSPRPVLLVAGAGAAIGAAIILLAPGVLNVETDSDRALDRASSGRIDLIGGGVAMVRDRPLWGFGSGSFAERYRERENVSSEKVAAASHTIPLTIAAEQGVVGLAAYLALVAVTLALLFGGLRDALRGRAPWPGVGAVSRTALAAAYCALTVHTLVYAAFLEDPLSWVLPAIAAGLLASSPGEAEVDAADAAVEARASAARS